MTAPSTETDVLAYNFNIDIDGFLKDLRDGAVTSHIGQTFLHELAREGDVMTAEVILAKGVNPDVQDSEGRRPLHEAAAAGNLPMVRLLVRTGALLDAPIYPFGYTALYLAVERGHAEVAKYLIEQGARTEITDALNGQGLLHAAATRGHLRTAGVLIAAGLDVFARDNRGLLPRDLAARHRHPELERALLKVMEHHAKFGG